MYVERKAAGVGTLHKSFKTYEEQIAILRSRGMVVDDEAKAVRLLQQLNYYRLSGYWYPLRKFDRQTGEALDEFQPGTTIELVYELYAFDARLRQAVFAHLSQVELALRTLIGHELGRVDPLAHLDADKLGPQAKAPSRKRSGNTIHDVWVKRYQESLSNSKEDFVQHHKEKYAGELPAWVAVEIMDWGMLSHLYGMAPIRTKQAVARICGLSDAQLGSWLKSLNILRNYSAHHARLFNRVFDIKPKLSKDSRFDLIRNKTNRVFGQLTLIRYLEDRLSLPSSIDLGAMLESFPNNDQVPFSRTGAPEGWRTMELWSAE